MIFTEPAAAAAAFNATLAESQRILVLSHVSPDGDAIGSLLGLTHALRAAGKEVFPLASSALPDYAHALPGIETVAVYQPGKALPEVDLIWLVDTADLARVGPVFADHREALTSRPLVIVDHHVTNSGEGRLNLINPAAASCAELLFRLLQAMGLPLPPDGATCLLLGLTTDTQSFQTSSTGAESLRAAADLLEAGADQRLVIREVYFSVPESVVRLSSVALAGMRRDGPLLWTRLTEAMRQAADADDAGDDTINRMQRIHGMRVCALFKERAGGGTKISLRSVPGINVAEICRLFGGGGHAQAAGATLAMSIDEAELAVLPLLRQAVGLP